MVGVWRCVETGTLVVLSVHWNCGIFTVFWISGRSAWSLNNLWCLNSLLELVDDRYMSLCTRTCVLSNVVWIFWLVPASLLARRYRSRCWHWDTSPDFCTVWMDGAWCGNFRLKATLWKNMSVKSPDCWCRTLLPSLRGVGPQLRRSAPSLLLSTVKPLTGISAEGLVPWAWFGAATR